MILDKEYRQESFYVDPRMREVLGDTSLSEVSRTGKYGSYYILHSVPRKSNPSGTMDSDQYLVRIAIPEATYTAQTVTDFEAWVEALMVSAGNPLVFEDLS